MALSDNIRNARLEKHMTLQELAEKVNVTHPAIIKFEQGARIPNVIVAAQIADALGVDLNDLVKGETEKE